MIMLFHEIYSTYFQTVAKILAEAVEHPLTTEEINAIIQDYAFEENIEYSEVFGKGTLAIVERRWNNHSQKESNDATHNFAETLD